MSQPQFHHLEKIGGVSAKNIRAYRSDRYVCVCASCGKEEAKESDKKPLPKCSRCKSVYYCSKECQKADWPTHKHTCAEVTGQGIFKLVRNFLANPTIGPSFELLLCTTLKMQNLDDPTSVPHMARVDIGIEPCDVRVLSRILKGDRSSSILQEMGGRIPGMLQVNAVNPLPITPEGYRRWKEASSDASTDFFRVSRHGRPSVVMVKWVYRCQSATTFVTPVTIDNFSLMIARSKHDVPEGFMDPVVPEHNISFLNASIRSDDKNEYLLRKDMMKEDLDIIESIGKTDMKSEAARILEHKIKADPRYLL